MREHPRTTAFLAAAQSISWLLRTMRATFFLKLSRSSRHSLAASMLAGDSSFGEDSIEIMEIMMVSTCDGNMMTMVR